MPRYNINDKFGGLRCSVVSLEFIGKWMENSHINVTVNSPGPIPFALGDYIDYRGVRYVLNELPNVTRQHANLASINSVVYENIRFDSPLSDLKHCMFLDCIDDSNISVSSKKQLYSNSPNFDFFCADVTTLAERIQINLNRLYGKGSWVVALSDDEVLAASNVSLRAENNTVWDAVQWINTKFKTSYTFKQVKGTTKRVNYLIIGESLVLNNTFLEHGKGKGLTKLSRSRDDNSNIINRIRVYGSQKNIPTRYYNEIYDPWFRLPLQLVPGGLALYVVKFYVNPNFGWYYTARELVSLQPKVIYNNDPTKTAYDARFEITGGVPVLVVYHNKGTQDTFFSENVSQIMIVSGLSKSYMNNVKDYWLSPIPLAPHEMATSHLMLPSFLEYHTVEDIKIRAIDSIPEFNEEWNIKKVFNKKDGLLYSPIYVMDGDKHVLDSRGKWLVKTETDPYLEDRDSVSRFGIREGCVFFDSDDESSETPAIYPSIKGTTSDDVIAAGYNISLKQGDNGKLDQVFIGTDAKDYEIKDDGVVDNDTATDAPKSEFFIEIKDLGFDIKDYLSTERAIIKMTTGACAGREFEFVRNNNNPKKLIKEDCISYQLCLMRSIDETLDRYFPNKDAKISSGDEFVLLNIDLPRMYVDVAAQRLMNAGEEFLKEHATTTFNSITPTLDHIALAREFDAKNTNSLYYKLCEGGIILLKDEALGIEVDGEQSKYYIDSLTIREVEGKLPVVDVKLVKEKELSTIQKLQSEIKEVKQGGASNLTRVDAENIVRKVGNENYVNKTSDDTVNGTLTMTKTVKLNAGFETSDVVATDSTVRSKDYKSGTDGSGYALTKNENGSSLLDVDYVNVRKKMTVNELEIQKINAVGGKLLLTAASCTASKVEYRAEQESHGIAYFYRVYFRRIDGEGRECYNQWSLCDQAICQTFTVTNQQRYYWRLVRSTGTEGDYHYIDLSDMAHDHVQLGHLFDTRGFDEGSDIPKEGDVIVQLGSRLLSNRQSAIEIAGVGSGGTYIRQYEGIKTFSLPEPTTNIEPYNNKFTGRLTVESGSQGVAAFSDLPDTIKDIVQVGGENILKNTGFDGDYVSQKMEEFTEISGGDEVYGQRLEYWELSDKTSVVSVASEQSISGYACQLTKVGDWISQEVTLIKDEHYILSFCCQGEVGVLENVIGVENQANRFKIELIGSGSSMPITFTSESANALIWEVKLERGTVQTDWCPSREDKDKMTDEFKDLWYLQHAFKGKTDILGGLILSSIIQLGKYQNDVMQSETAGMSGIVEDPNTDVAFWGGGTLKQAINAVNLFKYDPSYQPTEAELANIAKAVITHGGRAILNDIVLRGYIYALGGVFNGTVYANDGVFKGRIEAKEGYFLGNTRNVMVDITKENIQDYAESGDGTWENPYYLDFDKTGFCVRFSGRFSESSENKSVYLQLPYMTQIDPEFGEARDKLIATNFSRVLIFNQAEKLELAIGIRQTADSGTSQTLKQYQVFEGSAKLFFKPYTGLTWEWTVHS